METKFKIFEAGLIKLAIPEAHFDEAVKLLSDGGVDAVSVVKDRFPETHEVPPFSAGEGESSEETQ